ncbi:MAG: histidine kinase [Actinomycetota bacterium]|nr:histidine kinase [Actinomycetota bacterium]MDP2288141.1 histidine kinase [Actinomycetota bacterium]
MTRAAATPVFVGLRTGLHVLFLALTFLVITRAVITPTDSSTPIVTVSIALAVTYGLGAFIRRSGPAHRRLLALGWLGVLTVEWLILLGLSPDAAYLVFPLFFLFLHLLGRWWGSTAIVTSTIVVICALGLRGEWTVGGVVGPLVGAGVALLIGLGYQALAREAEQREELMTELLNTRGQLAATEHESGVLAERARLAREIHDTLAQGLSSIQMLLYAAERADPDRPGVEYIRLARETAAANLAEARRFIRELTPPQLDDQGLGGALNRLARTQWATQGLTVNVEVSDAIALPMHLQTALLRIAQGAIANVIQHAHATAATVALTVEQQELQFTIVDNGCGFDPLMPVNNVMGKSDSFGLQATQERVEQLGGTLTIDAALGRGTTLAVNLCIGETP